VGAAGTSPDSIYRLTGLDCIVKCYWDEYEDRNREDYNGLDEQEFNALILNPNVEVMEHAPYADDSCWREAT